MTTQATCDSSYSEPHGRGHFTLCSWVSGATSCALSSVTHNCTWTSLMEDLMAQHDASSGGCLGELLEAKRSVDGLLHAGEELRELLEYQNRRIQINNGTIRKELQNQQDKWGLYMNEQAECQTTFATRVAQRVNPLIDEIEELRAIAYPDIRSAVNFEQNTGYQE